MLYYNIYIYGYKMLQNIVDVTSSSVCVCALRLQVAQVATKVLLQPEVESDHCLIGKWRVPTSMLPSGKLT